MQQLIKGLSKKFSISANEAAGIVLNIVVYAEDKYSGLGNSLTQFLQQESIVPKRSAKSIKTLVAA